MMPVSSRPTSGWIGIAPTVRFVEAPSLILLAIGILTVLPYRHLLGRGFSDSDDFLEVHRALAVDAASVAGIFTTSHYGDRYRPINRLLTDATAYISSVTPNAFLIRNLTFHLICVGLVFLIVLRLGRNKAAAITAACLFAFQPSNVNAVSVAVSTHTFAAFMVLAATYVFIVQIADNYRPASLPALAVSVSLVIAAFSHEMYLWVLPSGAAALAWAHFRFERPKAWLLASVLALGGLIVYVVARELVIEHPGIVAQSPVARNGLRDIGQVVQNAGMFLVASGMSLDYLHFFNPIDSTIPLGPALLHSPGVLVSSIAGLIGSLGAILAYLTLLRFRFKQSSSLALMFFVLFILSVSVVAIAVRGSETYLYLPNAFLAIAQGLAVVELLRWLDRAPRHRTVMLGVLATVILSVSVARVAGVEHRNQILADKAGRIAHMQAELREAVGSRQIDNIDFVPAGQTPQGYSVYGGEGLGLIRNVETPFVQLTLGTTKVAAQRRDAVVLKPWVSDSNRDSMILVVDQNGDMTPASVAPEIGQ